MVCGRIVMMRSNEICCVHVDHVANNCASYSILSITTVIYQLYVATVINWLVYSLYSRASIVTIKNTVAARVAIMIINFYCHE